MFEGWVGVSDLTEEAARISREYNRRWAEEIVDESLDWGESE